MCQNGGKKKTKINQQTKVYQKTTPEIKTTKKTPQNKNREPQRSGLKGVCKASLSS